MVEMLQQVEGKKRFIVALVSVIPVSLLMIALLVLFIIKMATFADISPLLTLCITVDGAVAGGYFGVQTFTDQLKIKNQSCGGKQP